jgi:Nuclease-related domain
MGLVVNRWRGHGLERLYVNDVDTKQGVGYYDCQTGKLVLKDEDRSYEVLEVLRPFLGSAVPEALRGLIADSPLPPTSDLMRNRAGQAVAARAAELRPRGLQGIAARLLGLRTEATSWAVGAKGEQVVDKRLGRLRRDGWQVLSAVMKRSGADIDHLVIGPPGVFTINTKHHRGARVWVGDQVIKVNNVNQPYLRNSRHEASSAARILTSAVGLEVRVTPVLAFVDAESIKIGGSQHDVLVTRGEEVDQALRDLSARYSFQERERILSIARRAEIWLA